MKFISPGRTGDVEKVWFKGKQFYAKTNPSKEITDIEERIYANLRKGGVLVPDTYRVDDTRILVADAGKNMADQTINGGYEKMQSKEQMLDVAATSIKINKRGFIKVINLWRHLKKIFGRLVMSQVFTCSDTQQM